MRINDHFEESFVREFVGIKKKKPRNYHCISPLNVGAGSVNTERWTDTCPSGFPTGSLDGYGL